MNKRTLKQSHYKQVEALFAKSFEVPLTDLILSWDSRDERSVGFFIYGTLIGFMIASYHASSKKSLYVDYFAVSEEFRGSGLGTELLRELIADTYARNESVHLFPITDKLALWYEKNGFRKTHGGYYVFHSYKTRRQDALHKELGLV